MPDDVEIDWSGFDPVEVPEAPPAEELAAQLDAEAIDQMAIVPALFDVKAFRITERNTYDCRVELKAMGCIWTGSAWVARDPAMREQAIDLCRVRAGKRPMFAQPAMAPKSQAAAAAAAARQAAKSFAQRMAEVEAARALQKAIPNGPSDSMAIANTATDELLIAEAQRRGFTIAKLGELEPLAELLVQQDDEEDPFGKILELLK